MKKYAALFLVASAIWAQAVPAGTAISVKTIDRIDSGSSQVGQTFKASLDGALVVNGTTIAPAGADAVLKIIEAKKAGKLKGKAELTVTLVQLKTGNGMVDLNTEGATSASEGKGKSSATKTAVGGAGGAILGGILGGGKGAAAGAGIGAGAGAGVAMLSGPKVVIPAETRLTFLVR
jgi:hypothetical protein